MTDSKSSKRQGFPKDGYTVDAATNSSLNHVPSVTRLLNRKKLGLRDAEKKPHAHESSGVTVAPVFSSEIEMERPREAPSQDPAAADPFAPILETAPSGESDPTQMVPLESALEFAPPQDTADAAAVSTDGAAGEAIGIQIQISDGPVITISPPERADQAEQGPVIEPALTAPAPTSRARIQPAARKQRSEAPALIVWELNQLANNSDPLGKGLALLFKEGADSALFLAMDKAPTALQVPHFKGTATAGSPSKKNLWTGLNWDPSISPDLWNYFLKAGHVEFTPPGTTTNQASARNVMRAAFGIQKEEVLHLIRVGPPNACRGVLAVVSKKNLSKVLTQALQLIFEKVQKP